MQQRKGMVFKVSDPRVQSFCVEKDIYVRHST